MSNTGWYPDPSGQPGQYRYWDGTGWSSETASHPSGPPPGSAPGGAHDAPTMFGQQPGQQLNQGGDGAPPTNVAPGGYGQQPPASPYTPGPTPTPGGGYGGYDSSGYGGAGYPGGGAGGGGGGYGGYSSGPQQPGWGGSSPAGSGGGNGKTIGLVVGVVLLVILLGVGTFFLVRGLSGDDEEAGGGGGSSSATDDTESPETTEPETTEPETTEPETPDQSTPADPTGLACAGGTPEQGGGGIQGGKLTSGGLTVDKVAGYEAEFQVSGKGYSQNGAFDFADGMTTVSRLINENWVAGYGIGSLDRARGYETPQQAAETAFSCLEQSDNYQNVTRRDVIDEGDVDLGPTTGYSITCDILAEAPGGIPGDRVVITVVDLGDDKPLGFYISYVPLGYNDLLRTQETVGETLAVG